MLGIKLDGLIDKGEWKFSDVPEHDYSLSPIVDCFKYYVAGYLSYKLTERTNCVKCQGSFTVSSNTNPNAMLTNIECQGMAKAS